MRLIEKIKSWFKPTLVDRSRESEKRHHDYLKSISPTLKTQRVFTSPISGVNWYMLSDPLNMREERSALLDEAVMMAEWNMTIEQAGQRFMSMPQKFETLIGLIKSDQKDVAIRRCENEMNACLDANHRLKEISKSDAILSIASIYFYIDGEDPSIVDPAFTLRKLELLQNDAPTRAFFLTNTFDTFKISTNVKGEDLANYLKEKMMFPKEEKSPIISKR